MEKVADPTEIIGKIEGFIKRIEVGTQSQKGNEERLNIIFGEFLGDSHGYTEECKLLRYWRIHHSDKVAEAHELLTRDYSEDLIVKELLREEDRNAFKEKLFSSELPKEVKQALVVCALDEDKYWSNSPHIVIQGRMEREIGGDPFEREFSAPCPRCGDKNSYVYKSNFAVLPANCGTCSYAHSIKPVIVSKYIERKPLKHPIHEKLDLPTIDEWNELKVMAESYVNSKVHEIKSKFQKDFLNHDQNGLANGEVKIDASNMVDIIPDEDVLMEISESEFVDVFRRVYQKLNEICDDSNFDASRFIGGFTNKTLVKKSLDDIAADNDYALNNKQLICSNSWSDAVVLNLIIDLGLLDYIRVNTPTKEWNAIMTFLSFRFNVTKNDFVCGVRNGCDWKVKFPRGMNIYSVSGLRKIHFSLSEERLLKRFGAVVEIRDQIQREKDDERAKFEADRRKARLEKVSLIKDKRENLGSRLLVIHSSGFKLLREILNILESQGVKVAQEERFNSRDNQGLLELVSRLDIQAGDIVLLGRGGGDPEHETFNAFKNLDSVTAIKNLHSKGAVVVMGVGMMENKYPMDSVVDYCEDNFRVAANRAAQLILES